MDALEPACFACLHCIYNYMRPTSHIATCMYYTGIDPFTGEAVATATKLSDRKMQRALLQFFKPENYFEVRKALLEAGRGDLIGNGCDALIPAQPPRGAAARSRARQQGAWRRALCSYDSQGSRHAADDFHGLSP